LIIVLAAINVGTVQFTSQTLASWLGYDRDHLSQTASIALQVGAMAAITFSQALFNHLGIKVTTRLTDFSGYWILIVAVALTIAMLCYAPGHDFTRLVTFTNFSGLPVAADAVTPVWPRTENVPWLFALGFLLPMYTITGFDASAHTSEETVGASRNVPRGIVRSVVVSGIFGWIMLAAVVLAIPDMKEAALRGENAFTWTLQQVLPPWLNRGLSIGIALAMYLCGLATVTSASRMAYAFARDGGLPFSHYLRRVGARYRTPAVAIWTISALAVAFTIYTPVYTTIATAAVIFLYLSYTVPTFFGLFAYRRSWTKMGPWSLGGWYRPLAVVCVLGCVFLVAIGVHPPNDKGLWILLGSLLVTAFFWFAVMRRHFPGPPQSICVEQRQADSLVMEEFLAHASDNK
jgi:amino acid transporter